MTLSDGSHKIIYDADDHPLYEGRALRIGADTTDAIWKIKKYVWASGSGGKWVMTAELWADGNQLYDNIWDNAALLIYV
jgi:hypothetical protein